MRSIPRKTCNKCKVEKPISEFGELSSSRDGYKYRCNPCIESFRSEKRRYAQITRKRYPELTAERGRMYRSNNKQKLNAASLKWYRDNSERARGTLREWYLANPDKYAEYANRRRVRKADNGVFTISTKFLRRLYTSLCVGCGTADNMTADHVVPIARGGTHSEGNLQPLCRTCNSSKGAKLMMEFRLSRPDLFKSKDRN